MENKTKTNNKKTLKVSCAVIYNPENQNKILICQRKKDSKLHPLEWEFLGGKFEKNETAQDCIKRELFEEIEIKIKNPKLIHSQIQYYGYANVELFFFEIKEFSGKIKNNVHQQIKWEKISNLKQYNFVKGDIEMVEILQKNKK